MNAFTLADGSTRTRRTGSRLDLRGIAGFLAIAYGTAWLLELPMALDPRGIRSPWAALLPLANFTPALATLVVVRWISPLPGIRRALGFRLGVRFSKWMAYCLFALVGITLLNLASPFVGALFGQFPLDLAHLSYLKVLVLSNPGGDRLLQQVSLQTLAIVTLVTLPLQALTIAPYSCGEEIGWRGYLLPRLLPLGQWRALLLSGVIWALWHLPLILSGVEYPQHRILGIALFITTCTILGTLLGWTRLATGSVWPAVLGHAAIDENQVLKGILEMARVGGQLDTATATLLGWTGWILPVAAIAFLVVTKRLPVRHPIDAPDIAATASAPAFAGLAAAR
jgi:uncharacterized protein